VVVVVVDGAVVAVPLAARSIGSLAVDASFLPRDGDADVVVERVGHVDSVADYHDEIHQHDHASSSQLNSAAMSPMAKGP